MDTQTGGYSITGYFGGTKTEGYKRYKEGQIEGKWRDFNDYLAKGGDATGMLYEDRIVKEQEDRIKEEKGYLDQYTSQNPFAFDEEIARKNTKTYGSRENAASSIFGAITGGLGISGMSQDGFIPD